MVRHNKERGSVKPAALIAVPAADRAILFEVMDALSLCVKVLDEFRFPSLMPWFESLPSLRGAYGMRFHLVHVPGVQFRVKLPLVFFHKLSMLIAHVTSDQQGLVMESMDLRSNGMVLQAESTKVLVLLKESNLFVLVKSSDGGKQLDRLYNAVKGISCYLAHRLS